MDFDDVFRIGVNVNTGERVAVRRNGVKKEDFETAILCYQLENVVVYSAFSKSLRKDDVVYYGGMKSSFDSAIAALAKNGFSDSDLHKYTNLPARTVVAHNGEQFMSIAIVEKLPHMNRVEREAFGIRHPGPSLRMTSVTLDEAGQETVSTPVLYRFARRGWTPKGLSMSVPRYTGKGITLTKELAYPKIAALSELSAKLEWSVIFRMPDSPGIRITSDPIGIRELMRIRDVPNGMSRRQALRHWVKGHYRKSRVDKNVDSEVRQHLRGATKCDWFGLNVEIVPSMTDEELNAAHKPKRRRERAHA